MYKLRLNAQYVTTEIINNRCMQCMGLFKNLKNLDLLVMPYLVPNQHHYCLIVGDLISKLCIFYNPMRNYPDSYRLAMKSLEHF